MESRISGIDERLKRIESIIDKLQASIIGKIGNYGQSLQDIRDEIGAMQESFSKAVNPLIDRSREAEKEKPKQKQEKAGKTKDKMEDYLTR